MDAFLGLPNWHRWRDIVELAHVVVAHRPGWSLPATGPLAELVAASGVSEVAPLHTGLSGRVYVHAVTQLEIASSELRAILISGGDPRFLVPEPVRRIKVNEPSHLVHTVRRVAQLRFTDANELAAQTADNARRLFGVK